MHTKRASHCFFISRQWRDWRTDNHQKIFKLKGNVLSDYHNVNSTEIFQTRTQEVLEIHNLTKK